MDFSYFVGKKLALHSNKTFTQLIMRLAIAGIALSLAVMIISVGIVKGFKSEIANKVIGFDGHVQIRNLDLNMSKELQLIDAKQDFIQEVKDHDNIESISAFCSKAGILSTDKDVEGLMFKGVGSDFNWDFFESHLRRGEIPEYTDTVDSYDILISEKVADAIDIDTGSRLQVFFLHEGKVRRRMMKVLGIFNTGMAEFDRTVCLSHVRTIQRIYTVDYSKVSGFEVRLKDVQQLDAMQEWLDASIGLRLKAQSVRSIHGLIFQWLEIVDSNAVIIIVLMLLVAMVNMVTAFLILIIERTNMIGVLKALGAANFQVVKIFLLKGLAMIIPGVVIGNIVALTLVFIQTNYGLITLNEDIYYMSLVPLKVETMDVVWLNCGTVLLCALILLIPGLMVRRISPVKAIRFD